MKTTHLLSALVSIPLLVLACSAAPEPGNDVREVVGGCDDGATKSCTCSGGGSGSKTCSSSGKWGSCDCTTVDAAPPVVAPSCTELKACEGIAIPGTLTPTSGLDVKVAAAPKAQIIETLRAEVASGSPRARYLAAALAAPQANEHESVTYLRQLFADNVSLRNALGRNLPQLGLASVESYRAQFPVQPGAAAPRTMDGTVDACAPSLRIRLGKITVTEEDDDVENDEVYCSISATAKDVQELRITPKTRALDEGESQTFSGDETVVWGQGTPRATGGADITMKYDCFETDSAEGYGAFVKAAASAAKKYGNKVVSSDNAGYVSTGTDLVATFLPQILALDSDDHLFVAQQTIPAAQQKELAKGASWTIRKSGTHYYSDWDWTLTMEAWGCSINGVK